MRRAATTLLLFLTLSGVTACNNTPVAPLTQQFKDLPADQILMGVTFTSTVDGVRTATLKSDTVYMFPDSSVMHLRGVDLEIFDESGKQTAHLTSKTGVLNNTTQAMVARTDVVLIVVKDNQRIRTAELNYDPRGHRIWSDSVTQRTLNGETLTADKFTSDDQFQNVQMVGGRGATGVQIKF
jgi:LPS export ABC transporter protein LptC